MTEPEEGGETNDIDSRNEDELGGCTRKSRFLSRTTEEF